MAKYDMDGNGKNSLSTSVWGWFLNLNPLFTETEQALPTVY